MCSGAPINLSDSVIAETSRLNEIIIHKLRIGHTYLTHGHFTSRGDIEVHM